ncbi:uncharacterized protein [Battus philenor]|uniref:uncharacterized protein n=1 Tax=Battus philenor TaxID=42288 RepID=UPI0035CFCF7B
MLQMNIPIIIVNSTSESLPNGTISFEGLINDNSQDISILNGVIKNVDDIALLPYSSGTTGLPKGVELVHRSIVTNFVQQDNDGVRHCEHTTDSHQECVLAILPLFHMYGLSIVMLNKLSIGAKIVTLPKFETETYLKAIKKYNASVLHIAPPLASFLACHPKSNKEYLSSVHTYVCAAAPLPKHDIYRVLEKSSPNTHFVQLYGLTEVSPLATSIPRGCKEYTNVGLAVPNTKLRVVNSDDQNLGPDEVGELLIHGPQIMKGYRNNPEETKAAITRDGWFRTGDLVSIDKDGVVTVRDRIKELIKVKGFQVAPAELESILKEHPDIVDAAVIGVPDAKMGEVPKAFVVIKSDRNKDSDGIKNFVNDKVAAFKRLSDVEFVESLPRNPSGKILKRLLREKYT